MPHSTALLSLTERATSMARRLLCGVGSASFVAYRDGGRRPVDVLTHGLTADGDLVVAVLDGPATGEWRGTVPVRLDVRREAAEARVRVIAASVHLHGEVEWLDRAQHRAAVDSGTLPEAVALVASLPGVRVGLVGAERVLLHDASGVTPFSFGELVFSGQDAPFPTTGEELAAQEIVAAVPDPGLRALCDAVAGGRLAGRVLSDRRTRTTCAHTVGRVLCVDVDALGANLMRVDADRTSVVFVQFPDAVHDVESLREQVDVLRSSALGSRAGAQRGA